METHLFDLNWRVKVVKVSSDFNGFLKIHSQTHVDEKKKLFLNFSVRLIIPLSIESFR